MKVNPASLASRILAVLPQPPSSLTTTEVAALVGENVADVSTNLCQLRRFGKVDRYGHRGHKNTNERRSWSIAAPRPSNVVQLRPQPAAPNRMLPVIRRDDCVHEPACSMAAALAWPEAEGMSCPWVCEDYRRGKREPVSVQRSNWMGGEG